MSGSGQHRRVSPGESVKPWPRPRILVDPSQTAYSTHYASLDSHSTVTLRGKPDRCCDAAEILNEHLASDRRTACSCCKASNALAAVADDIAPDPVSRTALEATIRSGAGRLLLGPCLDPLAVAKSKRSSVWRNAASGPQLRSAAYSCLRAPTSKRHPAFNRP